MPHLHLGINTCFAVKRWPGPEQWLTIVKNVYLFLEPIHPFEADDASVLDDLRQSVQYWREAMQQ
jgi:hypothetical protein